MRSATLTRYLLFAVALAVLAVFLIWPIFLTVRGGFVEPGVDGGEPSWTFRYIYDFGPHSDDSPPAGVLQNPVLRRGLLNSLAIATCTTILCLIVSLPLALLATKHDFFGKRLVTSTILVPLILPPFVGAIGMRALLGRTGAVNEMLRAVSFIGEDEPGYDFLGGAVGGRFLSVVVMEALHLYPILYLNVAAALANLDPALDEAALNFGASRFKRLTKITWPLILPGVFAGGTIVFIWSFTELGTPLMFDFYEATPVQIFFKIGDMYASPQPYALTVVMLTVAIGLYVIGKVLIGGKAYVMQAKASVGASASRLNPLPSALAFTAFISIALLAVLPHIGVVLASITVDGSWYRTILPQALTFEHYGTALSDPLATTSIQNSLFLSLAAMALCVCLGLLIAYLVVRCKVKGGFMLDSLAMLPLAVPGLVMAFGYVALSLRINRMIEAVPEASFWHGLLTAIQPWVQVRGDNPNPFPLLVIAYAVRRLPYIVRSASAGLQQTSGSLEEAALNLGASTPTAIRRVVIPLIAANLIAGAILVFAFSMLEVSDSLILAEKGEHFPITKAIYEFFSRLGDGPYVASAMGVWGMALLSVTLIGASVLMGKKLGAVFRA